MILALEIDHKPLKSSLLASLLDVSDSYLKKILRKLVVGGVVKSEASKDGGFVLARQINTITLFDVYSAVQGIDTDFTLSHLGNQIFDDESHVVESEGKIIAALQSGIDAFYASLKKLPLSELLKNFAVKNGAIDWENK